MGKEQQYRFSLGDSNTGAVGICLDVAATSERAAFRKLRKVLRYNNEVSVDLEGASGVRLYLNGDSKAITVDSLAMVS